jgi:hypothetical protein
MKRSFIFLLLLIFALAACAPNQEGKCDQGVCVEIHAADIQNQDGSVTVTITVTSDTDRDPVGVSLNGDPGTIFENPEIGDGQVWEGGNLISWQVNARVNQPVSLTCNARFPGTNGSFSLRVMATYSTRIRVYNGVYAQLNDGTLVPDRKNSLLLNSAAVGGATATMRPIPYDIVHETPTPGPTPTIFIPPTPTLESPTETPTSTFLVYPPPLEAAPSLQENGSLSTVEPAISYPAP